MGSDGLYLIGSIYFQLKGSCEHANKFSGFKRFRISGEKHPLAP